MANEKRLIDANHYHSRVDRIGMDELFPNWKRLPRDVKEMLIKLGKEHERQLFAEPTVDAEPVVHGRWVAKETMIRSPFAENYYCSECQTSGSPQWKRCPVCEAKMDGERKDNEKETT